MFHDFIHERPTGFCIRDQAGRKPKASEQRGKISKNFVLALNENQDPFTNLHTLTHTHAHSHAHSHTVDCSVLSSLNNQTEKNYHQQIRRNAPT